MASHLLQAVSCSDDNTADPTLVILYPSGWLSEVSLPDTRYIFSAGLGCCCSVKGHCAGGALSIPEAYRRNRRLAFHLGHQEA